MDTHTRSLAKAVSWQLLGLLSMMLIGYIFTGSLRTGGGLAITSAVLGTICYIAHERAWSAVRWGRCDAT